MDSLELGRRCKRNCDVYLSPKRLIILIIVILTILLYTLPDFARWIGIRKQTQDFKDDAAKCLEDRLTSFYSEIDEFNVNIRHIPVTGSEKPYVAYIGNGLFGIDLTGDRSVYIRSGRSLILPGQVFPIFYLKNEYMSSYQEAYVTNYLTGIVHVFHCYESGLYATFQYYAHRTQPSILVQEIKISNPTDINIDVNVDTTKVENWSTAVSHTISLQQGGVSVQYRVVTASINISKSKDDVIAATVVHRKYPVLVEVEARSAKSITLLTSLNYSSPIKKQQFGLKKNDVEKSTIDALKKALSSDLSDLKATHAQAWQNLWSTGLTVGTSKASGALNGDKINATQYYVLSQVSLKQVEGSSKDSTEIASRMSYAEGCFGGYHTLDAKTLWGSLDTIDDVNKIVSLWLLTLEKVGCHNLIKAGALGVQQAMVLSFGGLRFSNQHLEFSIHPKYLHRDYLFRRISYGIMTHVNISIVVGDDNKANLFVALDRSDKNYYACDGGCLDDPILLSQDKKQFPVKLTEPLTPILYITYDKQHMEDLKHTIHVKEIAEAPAHDNLVIALHKHGHHLGGLPTFFWVAVSTLIIIFHLFLFKLIYNEYCSGSSHDKHRFRYGKL